MDLKKKLAMYIAVGTTSAIVMKTTLDKKDTPPKEPIKITQTTDLDKSERSTQSINSFHKVIDSFQGPIEIANISHEEINGKYSYIPTSTNEFLSMAEQAVKILNESPDKKNDFYTELCQFYDTIKDKEIDLNNPAIRKAFLAYKKILKRGPNFVENSPGFYDEQSYLLGIDAESFHKLTLTASTNMYNFCTGLYARVSDVYGMINPKDAPKAEKIADQLLQEKLDTYGAKEKDVSFCYYDFDFHTATHIHDIDNEWNDWNLQLTVSPTEFDGSKGYYCPLSVIKSHELGHIMQSMPGEKKDYSNKLVELAPTVELVVMQDIIYKKIHHIPLDQEVKYPCESPSDVNLGKIANTFRKIKEQHHLRSYEDVMLTPEANKAINLFMTQKAAQNALSSQREIH